LEETLEPRESPERLLVVPFSFVEFPLPSFPGFIGPSEPDDGRSLALFYPFGGRWWGLVATLYDPSSGASLLAAEVTLSDRIDSISLSYTLCLSGGAVPPLSPRLLSWGALWLEATELSDSPCGAGSSASVPPEPCLEREATELSDSPCGAGASASVPPEPCLELYAWASEVLCCLGLNGSPLALEDLPGLASTPLPPPKLYFMEASRLKRIPGGFALARFPSCVCRGGPPPEKFSCICREHLFENHALDGVFMPIAFKLRFEVYFLFVQALLGAFNDKTCVVNFEPSFIAEGRVEGMAFLWRSSRGPPPHSRLEEFLKLWQQVASALCLFLKGFDEGSTPRPRTLEGLSPQEAVIYGTKRLLGD
jgi:hypothetical protein